MVGAGRWGWLLVGVLALGAGLRLWNLGGQPLWLDEVLTLLFSLGRSLDDVPLELGLGLGELGELLRVQPMSCGAIASTLAAQSTHPPLFFCAQHLWLRWLNPDVNGVVWGIRVLPVVCGVGAIALGYGLNWVAFSPRAAVMGAVVMAVSPFGVYLSQEARHYSFGMALVTLALFFLVQIQRDWQEGRWRWGVWLGWVGTNLVGLYVHYLMAIALVVQGLVLVGHWVLCPAVRGGGRGWGVALALGVIGVGYGPWLPVLLSQSQGPETEWLGLAHPLAPVVQTLLGWMVMVIALPGEQQPAWVVGLSAGVMGLFTGWLVRGLGARFRSLWVDPRTRLSTVTLVSYGGGVVLVFWAIALVTGKDITAIPRYNFVYYPAVASLLGAALVQPVLLQPTLEQPRESAIHTAHTGGVSSSLRNGVAWRLVVGVVLAGLVSSGCVVSGLVFQKPYQPHRVARQFTEGFPQPLLMVVGSRDVQDVALGVSLGLEVQRLAGLGKGGEVSLVFVDRSRGYRKVWLKLARMGKRNSDAAQETTRLSTRPFPQAFTQPFQMWVVAPGLRRRGYRQVLRVSLPGDRLGRSTPLGSECRQEPEHYFRVGIPFQRYQCHPVANTESWGEWNGRFFFDSGPSQEKDAN